MNKNSSLAFALSFALVASPFMVACGNKDAGQEAAPESTTTETTDQAALDMESWTTLGDALKTATGSLSWGSSDKYFVCTFEAGDALVRVVGEMEDGINEKLGETDFFADDYDKQVTDVVGGLKLVSAQDLSGNILSQEEIDALVGKTGQELLDDGFTFSSYYMYGGEETGANFERDYIGYDLTFSTSITEETADSDDQGDSLKDAVVTAAEYIGPSDGAIDPEKVD